MGNNTFEKIAKASVVEYVNSHFDNASITEDSVYIVWLCKTLQNNKALLSTTISDGMYYEITYNGDKDELYIDVYKKLENICVKNLTDKI